MEAGAAAAVVWCGGAAELRGGRGEEGMDV